jgi:hypothetical protein
MHAKDWPDASEQASLNLFLVGCIRYGLAQRNQSRAVDGLGGRRSAAGCDLWDRGKDVSSGLNGCHGMNSKHTPFAQLPARNAATDKEPNAKPSQKSK